MNAFCRGLLLHTYFAAFVRGSPARAGEVTVMVIPSSSHFAVIVEPATG